MLYIIWKQILKYRTGFLLTFLFWAVSGYIIYSYRYEWVSFLYRITTSRDAVINEDPEKAYRDFFLPAITLLEKHQVQLHVMKELCPDKKPEVTFSVPDYEWDFLKKNSIFSFYENQNPVTLQPSHYWKEKQEYVAQAILFIKEGMKYAPEIPETVTREKKRILLPLLLQELFEAICLPQESKIFWNQYIQYLERLAYRKLGKKQEPLSFDLELLYHLTGDEKYRFALLQYIDEEKTLEYFLPCFRDSRNCDYINIEENLMYLNKLIFISDITRAGKFFLQQARFYVIKSEKTRDSRYYDLAIDRYRGAIAYEETKYDAYVEMAYVFLKKGMPDIAHKTILELLTEGSFRYNQNTFYRDLVYRILIQLQHYKDADCLGENIYDSRGCKDIRKFYKLE